MTGYPVLGIILLVSIRGTLGQQPRVTTENGVVVGKYVQTQYGSIYQAFEGIPYAKPPIGDRRFRDPEAIDGSWIGEWNATQVGSICIQQDHFARRKNENGDWEYLTVGDEDCLFVNVYTKEGYVDKDVVVIIHGGAFMFGSGDIYSPDYMMDSEDVVAVNFNYRLGPIGFLSTGDSVSPGNYGLKDQTFLLEWVQRNIETFGGSPKKVTIIGLSAGGASVHYHYLTDLSKGLFQRGFSFSGSALCPWAFTKNGPEKTRRLAEYLGCPTASSELMVECLRKRPSRQIVEQLKNFKVWMYNPITIFGPVAEVDSPRPFLRDEPRNLLKQRKVQDEPWVVSFTSHEGLYPGADFVDDDRFMSQLDDRWSEVAPSLLAYEESLFKRDPPISSEIRKHYLGNKKIVRSTIQDVIKMMSDQLFIAANVESAILQAQANTKPVYVYRYDCVGSKSLAFYLTEGNKTFGSCHGDDFIYLIKFGQSDTHITKNDKSMAKLLFKNLHNYIKTGSPSMPVEWTPVSKKPGSKLNYLHIKSIHDMKMRKEDNVGNIDYLRQLFDIPPTNRDEL